MKNKKWKKVLFVLVLHLHEHQMCLLKLGIIQFYFSSCLFVLHMLFKNTNNLVTYEAAETQEDDYYIKTKFQVDFKCTTFLSS